MEPYSWTARDEFQNRAEDLARMEQWWDGPTRDALVVLGRRRVGKSWLFRRLANEKPALILVADEVLPATQMNRFADELEPVLGVRPDIPDVSTLIQMLYRLGDQEKVLVVIDEFPYLLPGRRDERQAVLSQVQAVMEAERDQSQTKLMLCGSVIAQMESLFDPKSPLHGRLQALDVWPMGFTEARELMDDGDDHAQRITRYAVAGGMARYLAELGSGAPLQDLVCDRVLDRRGPLFSDPRNVLEQELRSPATYLSILEALSHHAAPIDHLANTLQQKTATLSPYLATLEAMRLVSVRRPVGSPAGARGRHYNLSDGFIRFWFRFVFPNQTDLQSGLAPEDLWAGLIEEQLPDFVAPTYETLCTRYARMTYGALAPTVGGWWGNALNEHRKTGARSTEEIDIVGAQHKNLRLVGECKWTASPMPQQVLDDLRTYKVPAIAQEGNLRVTREGPRVLLFARSGFESALEKEAANDDQVDLIGLEQLVDTLNAER